ncbi:hypothetical protein BDW62DRAFT_94484 [Aspergillus aurantiobrunneus]
MEVYDTFSSCCIQFLLSTYSRLISFSSRALQGQRIHGPHHTMDLSGLQLAHGNSRGSHKLHGYLCPLFMGSAVGILRLLTIFQPSQTRYRKPIFAGLSTSVLPLPASIASAKKSEGNRFRQRQKKAKAI